MASWAVVSATLYVCVCVCECVYVVVCVLICEAVSTIDELYLVVQTLWLLLICRSWEDDKISGCCLHTISRRPPLHQEQ